MFGNNRTKLILQLAQGASETHEAEQIGTKCTNEENKSTKEVLLVDTSTSTVAISNSDWHYTIEEFDPSSTLTKISADSLSEKVDTVSTTKNENSKMTPEEECSQEFQHESVQPQVCIAPNSQESQTIPGPLFTPLSSDSTNEATDHAFSSGSGELYEPSENESQRETVSQEEGEISLNNEEENQIMTENRKRKGQDVKCSKWKRQKNAHLRLTGKGYIGFGKNELGKYEQVVQRAERSLLPRCNGHQRGRSTKGGPNQAFECSIVSEEERQSIFTRFWNLTSWEAKQVFVTGNVLKVRPKHRRRQIDNESSRKKMSLKFYLTVKEDNPQHNIKRHVCKRMFLNTLCIGEKAMRSWILDDGSTLSAAAVLVPEENVAELKDRITTLAKDIEEFLNLLPKIESHYCRSSSSKLYLEPTWYSFRDLHRHYAEKCRTEDKPSPSWKVFLNVVHKMNIDIYTPKKDQCNKCTMFKHGNLDEKDYQTHIEKKNEARSQKENDKSAASEFPEIQSYTVDLQAVLLSPRLNAAANYYKTKLKVHNLTYYNLSTKDVVCYVWHEACGGLESDVFASIAVKYFQKEIDTRKLEKLIIWSDGCGYQNRNTKLSNALLELSIKNNVLIEQKYLEVGHTQMEVDSIHASIEKKLGKKREVYVPADYLPIIQAARLNPKPYETVYLHHDDFLKYEPAFYKNIRPGNKVGDPCVNDVVAYQYTPGGIMNYKLSFQDEWKSLPTRPKRVDTLPDHSKLYEGPCPIEASKFGHLQELKTMIPKDYQSFYDTLIYK